MGLAATDVSSGNNDVFFTEYIYALHDFISQGVLLDISDIMEERLTAYGETRSIEDKLTQEQKKLP